ncbi:helix-turn-helix transcriptional regulator [Rhodococcus opacus]|uniref:helix-turn-helix transcriptional regulator n=1 Tax=Rhodococcus opacus TaxID=37919 RepID=UPI001C459899|nr:helix-turn-helix transcriptional regulator [Rhodococcus opacus]MBV6756728.1 helix-turn-helix transcriptional regulator [Rhodococcus opacus]
MGQTGCAKSDLRDFLITRRARITPAMAGLAAYGANRRVKGLRREEVAMLAGISSEYYTRLERGNATGASPSVVNSVADVLQLTDVEREHLTHLVDAINKDKSRKGRGGRSRTGSPKASATEIIRPNVQILIDAIALPTFVFNRTLDVVAANRLGRLLYSPMFDDPIRPANAARFAFLGGEAARLFWPNRQQLLTDAVAELRAESGRDPYDPALIHLVGYLSTQSEEFRVRWASHNVRKHQSGIKTLHHPLVGPITMPFEKYTVSGDEGLIVQTYTPTPGSPAHDSLQLLSSWDGGNVASEQGAKSKSDLGHRSERSDVIDDDPAV